MRHPPSALQTVAVPPDPVVVRSGPFPTEVRYSEYRRTVAFPVENKYCRRITETFIHGEN